MSISQLRNKQYYPCEVPELIEKIFLHTDDTTLKKIVGCLNTTWRLWALDQMKTRFSMQLTKFITQIQPHLPIQHRNLCPQLLNEANQLITVPNNFIDIDHVINSQKHKIADLLKNKPNILPIISAMPALPNRFTHIYGLTTTYGELHLIRNNPQWWTRPLLEKSLANSIAKSPHLSYIKDCALLLPVEIINFLLTTHEIDKALEIAYSLSVNPTVQSALFTAICSHCLDSQQFERALEIAPLISSKLDQEVLFTKFGQEIWKSQQPHFFDRALKLVESVSIESGQTLTLIAFVRFLVRNNHLNRIDTILESAKTPQKKALIQECIAAELFYNNKEQESITTLCQLFDETPTYKIGRYISSIILPDIIEILIEEKSWDLAWFVLLSYHQPLPVDIFNKLSENNAKAYNIPLKQVWLELSHRYLETNAYQKTVKLVEAINSSDPCDLNNFFKE